MSLTERTAAPAPLPGCKSIKGKTYVKGPVPFTGARCDLCAGAENAALCGAFGYECLHDNNVYWVEGAPSAEDQAILAADAAKPHLCCANCGTDFVADRAVQVHSGEGGAVQPWCPDCASDFAVTCAKCGDLVPESSIRNVDGAEWCVKCADTHAVACVRCGVWHSTGSEVDVVIDAAGTVQKWCNECATRRAFTCGHCGKRVNNDISATVEGSSWCPNCVSEHTYSCERCGNPAVRLTLSEPLDMYLCRHCVNQSRAGTVHGYHGFRQTLKFWGARPVTEGEAAPSEPQLFLGFELESGGGSETGYRKAVEHVHSIDPGYFHCHMERDGSIPNYGFELVSAPHTLEAHAEYKWKDIVKGIAAAGLRSHDCGGQCGLHVHVSRNFLTGADCTKIDLFVQKNVTFWEKVSRRSAVHYAKYVNKGQLSEYGQSSERYCAVNFCPERTVEFRLFRGTLKYDTLMATLELVDGLCRWIKTRNCIQICRNDKETAAFAAWMARDEARYGHAIAYIAQREAVKNANDGSPDPSNPEL